LIVQGRFWQLLFDYLKSAVRHEWQMAILALGCLAPGVAALTAWLQLAWRLSMENDNAIAYTMSDWLLPPFLLDALGVSGILVGMGVVTLLVGCLGLTNAYMASVKRRVRDFALFLSMGMHQRQVMALLFIEVLMIGLLGCGAGLIMSIPLSYLSWPASRDYFQLAGSYHLYSLPLLAGGVVGLLAALLFMGLSGWILFLEIMPLPWRMLLRDGETPSLLDSWREWKTSGLGSLYAAILVFTAGAPILSPKPLIILTSLGLLLSALLSGGGWLLTRLYPYIPTPQAKPLWRLAVQGLARHPRHTASLTLALTTGSYGVGIAALGWVTSDATFSFWVAAMILISGASLVLTAASLAVLERRRELALIMALGARPQRVWRLILLEYSIVALGGGTLGALMALINWAWVMVGRAGSHDWRMAVAIVIDDKMTR